jgi:hypothetical protein
LGKEGVKEFFRQSCSKSAIKMVINSIEEWKGSEYNLHGSMLLAWNYIDKEWRSLWKTGH